MQEAQLPLPVTVPPAFMGQGPAGGLLPLQRDDLPHASGVLCSRLPFGGILAFPTPGREAWLQHHNPTELHLEQL